MQIKDLWQDCFEKKRAIPSFNFTSFDVALTIAREIKKNNYQCLLSTSERELTFQTIEIVVAGVKELQKQGYPVYLNLDHGKNIDLIRRAIEFGFDCIHFDGSALSLSENITRTKTIVALCADKHISVEGEVGKIGGSSSLNDESSGKSELANPEDAIRFVKETDVDILAVSYGSGHGFSKEPEILKTDILDAISKNISVPFVLHGGSGINKEQIRKSIESHVVKINFNTELRLAWSSGIKEYMEKNPQDIIPANILAAGDNKLESIIKEKLSLCMT